MLNVKSNILKSMRGPIGSQCESFVKEVIWSDLLIPGTKRVAALSISVSHSITCYNNPSAT